MGFILLLLLLSAILGPGIWAKHTLKKYSSPLSHLSGTGGELAQHLIQKFKLSNVSLEETALGDHYDPQSKTVRLSPKNLNEKSLTAIATAAHEIGHALQDACNYPPLKSRTILATQALTIERAGAICMMAAPVILAISRSPLLGLITVGIAVISMLVSTLVHLITLPVEWDASFSRALPILQEGNYLSAQELKITQKILTACALTYVAQSLMSLLNIGRWIRLLKR